MIRQRLRLAGWAGLLLATVLLLWAIPAQTQQKLSSPVPTGSILLGYKLGINLNAAPIDTAVPLWASAGKYVIRQVLVTNATVSLATSPAALGIFTTTGGAGAIVAAATITTLTSTATATDLKVLTSPAAGAAGVAITTNPLYVRVTIAHGAPASIDLYVFGDILP